MRAIRKAAEPGSLTRHRVSKFANFDNYPAKEELRNALVREQRGLCCYCLSRIPASSGMKIEHWHSQAEFEHEQLDYSNLLGACRGNEGQPHSGQHCDTRKGRRLLSRNPANPVHAIESVIEFGVGGRVSAKDQAFGVELDEVLNLNVAFLRNNRKAVLDAFTNSLGRGSISDSVLEKHLRKWNGEAHVRELEPFCQVVVYWLRRRLRRSR